MTLLHGFELVREEELPDLKSAARLYRHVKTGAELMSVVNDDENKAFCITFRTPPADSTGVAHILEHSVLCGSRKYPLKEPFIELVKGSLNTFLNAMTGSAETYYPVASLNTRDFYNLVDVYLDSVFHPRLTPQVFQQEGWHLELADKNDPLIYKGVVFNEMKGAYQSSDRILFDYADRSLFPGHVYGVSAGGDPKNIPDLTFEQLDAFHKNYYHPSNARIWFWGDDDPAERLRLLDATLSEFAPRSIDASVPLAARFDAPRHLTQPYAVGEDGDGAAKGMMSLNWLITDVVSPEFDIAMDMLKHILTGTPASPLRKALIDSGMVEHVSAGTGETRQRTFCMGLKGVDPANAGQVEKLVLDTLASLAKGGITIGAVEAAVNTVEFSLRELNTGGLPRGLALAFYTLNTWLYDGDPFVPLHFEPILASIRAGVAAGGYFETKISDLFLENTHRTVIVYPPDPGLAEREAAEERARLGALRTAMTEADLEAVVETTLTLQRLQQTPDSEEALATLPRLELSDLDPRIKLVPSQPAPAVACRTLFHDLATNGILYVDLGFNLHVVPQRLTPYLPLFGRCLLQMGTETEDFVSLTQRIGRKTGGIKHDQLLSSAHDATDAVGRLFLRSKATPAQAVDLVAILRDILLTVRLDNPERFRQMVMEEKVRLESMVAASGHAFVARRLGARFTQSGWMGEQMGGITYLGFIRDLAERVVSDWPSVLESLEQIRAVLFDRAGMIANVTLDEAAFRDFEPLLAELVGAIPVVHSSLAAWDGVADRGPEALTIPGQVNFVGKAVSLQAVGYEPTGAALVVNNLVRTTWLWEKVRVEGGAYGGFCSYDHINGIFGQLSYRDPNVLRTLDIYDGTADYLRRLDLSSAEMTRNIIGTISDLDAYQLPDAKGYTQMVRELIGETEDMRQRRRDQVLGATVKDLNAFGEALASASASGEVCIVGSTESIEKANEARPGWLKVSKAL